MARSRRRSRRPPSRTRTGVPPGSVVQGQKRRPGKNRRSLMERQLSRLRGMLVPDRKPYQRILPSLGKVHFGKYLSSRPRPQRRPRLAASAAYKGRPRGKGPTRQEAWSRALGKEWEDVALAWHEDTSSTVEGASCKQRPDPKKPRSGSGRKKDFIPWCDRKGKH